MLWPGCISQGLELYWSKRSDMSRPFPPVHHGPARWSQKSLTTTNISAVAACVSLISCRGDIFRVSQPLWRGWRAEPSPHPHSHVAAPYHSIFQIAVQHSLWISAHCCHTVRYIWLVMVLLSDHLTPFSRRLPPCAYSVLKVTFKTETH